MAYTAVPTQATGRPWTARMMNRYVRDNFAAGIPGLMTTKGDIVAATGADAGARVAVGADGAVLQALSTQAAGMQWSMPCNARYTGTGITIGDGEEKRLLPNTSVYDTHSAVTTGNNWVFTAPYAGYFWVTLYVSGSAANWSLSNTVWCALYVGGSKHGVIAASYLYSADASTYNYALTGSDIVYMTAGQTLYATGYYSGGATVSPTFTPTIFIGEIR